MKRRTFVASGVGLGTAVAGCLSDGPTGGSDPADGEGNGESSNETDDPGDGTDGTPTDGSEDPPEGNDSDGAENDDPDGQADGSGYTVALENDPVEDGGEFATLRVELVDPHVEPDSPAAIEATLSNTTDEAIVVSSGAPSPFGVVWAESDDGGESITLWTDAYEESEYVGTEGKRVEGVDHIGVGEEIEAGDSVTRTFEIHEDTPGLEPGAYETSLTVGIGPRDDSEDRESLETELVLTIGDGDPGNDGTDDPDEAGNGGDAGYTVALENEPVEDSSEFAALEFELVDPHVEAESPAAIEATLANTVEEAILVTSGAPAPFGVLRAEPDDGEAITLWSDAYEETDHVQTDGRDVEMFTNAGIVSELEAGESTTRTLEIHAETSNLEAGTYESSIGLEIEFGDEGNHNESRDPDGAENLEIELVITVERGLSDPGNGDGSDARIDEPPYDIEKPEAPDDPAESDDWNEHYLGEEMPADPSIGFEELDSVRLETRALSIRNDEGDQYAVDLVESEGDLDERFNLGAMDPEDRERVDSIDFDERVIVVVESGFGSGSVRHRWKRVEDVERGVHLHGYYTQPYERTDDYTAHQSVVVVERPAEDVDMARASLTVSPERRVHFDSTEGVVTVEGGD